MRQLVRVVAAAGALLGVLARPAPAAAETSAQCLANLNAYRAKASLAKASDTTATAFALGRAAGNHGRYRVNVDPGDSIELSRLGLPDLGLFGPDRTAHLETPALVKLGFTGVNPWDRTRAAKLADAPGATRTRTSPRPPTSPRLSSRRPQLGRRPVPPVPLMAADTRHIGCAATDRTVSGSVYSGEVLEMAATLKDTAKRITVYPASGQKAVPTSFNRCQEHPTPFGGPCDTAHPVQTVGYVVTIQADGYYAMKVEGFSLTRGRAVPPVDVHRAVRAHITKTSIPSSSVDTNLPLNAAMLAARAPLAPATSCNVRISGLVQSTKGGRLVRFKARAWSFTTT